MFAYTAATRTTFYLTGHEVGLSLAPPSLEPCVAIYCGPSILTCTVPAGAYTVQVYLRNAALSPWALATIQCVATPATPCA